jgi:hypothetical protein
VNLIQSSALLYVREQVRKVEASRNYIYCNNTYRDSSRFRVPQHYNIGIASHHSNGV